METFLINALQLILALALVTAAFNLGHYLWARIFKIRVERFYIFLHPWFSLFKLRSQAEKGKTGLLVDDTIYTAQGKQKYTTFGLGWLPLGGYVKIAGMIDESMDTEQTDSGQKPRSPQPWEFRSKPAWQRLLVMTGGVLNTFILAIIIYAGIVWYWGDRYIPFDKAYEGMDYSPAMQGFGFQNGDILLSADGRTIDASDRDIFYKLLDADRVTVLRHHIDTVAIAMPSDAVTRIGNEYPMTYRVPVFVKSVVGRSSPAAKAGLQEGDRIVAVGDFITSSYTEFEPALKAYAGQEVSLTVVRGNDTIRVNATPDEAGKLGFQLMDPSEVYPFEIKHYNLLTCIPKGICDGTGRFTNYVKSLKYVATKEGAKSVGGFGAIGSMFPVRWNWRTFWEMCAFLSLLLTLINLLPFPALDGGHVMFLLWEVVTGRAPGDKFMEYAQGAGMAFLIALLIYANFNDIYRFFF